MAEYITTDTELTAVANAIREKTGKSEPIAYPVGFVSEIGSISGGGGGGGGDDVKFFDYDGTLVTAYSASDFANLSAMPENPSHTGLVAKGWNWSLANAKAYVAKYGKLNIGQMYATDDGKTRIYIHLDEGRTNPILGICANGTVDVDWGDGTTHDTLTGSSLSQVVWTSAHNYAAPGDYVIKLTTSEQIGFVGDSASDAGCCILRGTSGSNNINYYYRNAVKKIECGEHIVSIGAYAFTYCTSLSSIIIPDSVTSIETYAFDYCQSLSSISIHDSVTSIGNYAFRNCYSLSSVSISDSVTSIGNYVFGYCYSLSSISIPDSVTSIGANVFNSCYSITSISISDSVASIGANVFTSCSSLSNIRIPDDITSIENAVFAGCQSLSSIRIPDGDTSIGNIAFISCYSLSSISIPDSVTSIGQNAFSNCYSIKEFHFLSSTPPTLVSTNAFSNIPSDCIFYIPAGSLNAYQNASNWSNFTSRFVEESA